MFFFFFFVIVYFYILTTGQLNTWDMKKFIMINLLLPGKETGWVVFQRVKFLLVRVRRPISMKIKLMVSTDICFCYTFFMFSLLALVNTLWHPTFNFPACLYYSLHHQCVLTWIFAQAGVRSISSPAAQSSSISHCQFLLGWPRWVHINRIIHQLSPCHTSLQSDRSWALK